MDLLDYYAGELAFLRETAQAFATANPAVAGALQDRGTDPDVERLLEGTAFLAAGLRARIDQAGAQVAHSLAELTLPHFLRSLPATTIVEFHPNIKNLRARQRVPRERPLLARPVSGTACRFRTCLDVDLWPLTVADARLDEFVSQQPKISVVLEPAESARPALADPQPLRFYIHHAAPAQAATLMQWFCRHCTGLALVHGDAEHAHLPPTAIDPIGLRGDPCIYPWPDTAPPAHRLLLERFTLPERAHFLDIVGLHAVAPQATELTLVFSFDRPPPLPSTIDPGHRAAELG